MSSSAAGLIGVFDAYQAERPWLSIPLAVARKFADDEAGSQAGLIAYYAFFSLFPLLLLFVTILGFVLQGDPSAQKTVTETALGQFPVIGADLKTGSLQGSGLALAIGLVGSLWGGLAVMQGIQAAFNRIWAVPLRARPGFLASRLRSLLAILVMGVVLLISSLASGLAGGGLGGTALEVAGIALSLVLNCLLLGAAFRALTAAPVTTRSLWIGALIGGLLWEILQTLGGYYVKHVVDRASGTYGTFALVIGLLAWLHIGAQVTLYAAEVNSVLARRLWPRSLTGPPRLAGDRRTLTDLARVEERSSQQRVDVRFEGDPAEPVD